MMAFSLLNKVGLIFYQDFEADDKTISRIDRLEGEEFLYTRGLINVEMNNGLVVETYVYIWNESVDIVRKVDFVNQAGSKMYLDIKKVLSTRITCVFISEVILY